MYTIHTFVGRRYMGQRECDNGASLGGVIAHMLEDCDSFYVKDAEGNIIIRYNKKGMR